MTYANLVKKLKAEVDVAQLGIKVNRIKKTEKGEVLVTVDGGEEKAAVLKEEIAKNNADLQITKRGTGRKKIFVMGMDPTTTDAELEKVLEVAVKIGEGRVKVLSLRAGRTEEKTEML